jgi:hypothetical protein
MFMLNTMMKKEERRQGCGSFSHALGSSLMNSSSCWKMREKSCFFLVDACQAGKG